VIGQKAEASGEFLPDDVPGTSGRLDVLLRCVRAALLWSHGIRDDVTVYLVLCGGPRAPRAMRIEGSGARFVRPDERSLATLARKTLASRADDGADGFVEVRPGIAIARDGLESALGDLGAAPRFVLEEDAPDIRGCGGIALGEAVFFVGDAEATYARTALIRNCKIAFVIAVSARWNGRRVRAKPLRGAS